MISPKVSEILPQFAWYFRKVPNSSRSLPCIFGKFRTRPADTLLFPGISETVQQTCLMVSESSEAMSHACTRPLGTAGMKRGCRFSENTKNDHLMTT